MANVAPAVFNVHVKPFLDGIWGGLRDPKPHIREASVSALEVGGLWQQYMWGRDRPACERCCGILVAYQLSQL
jgi:hypothetical protein